MNLLNNRFYQYLEAFSNLLILNLLWLLMCIPIITIFPSTTAMFGVVRKWTLKQEPSVFKTFFLLFKENFLQSMIIGLIWITIGVLLYIDFYLIQQLNEAYALRLFLVSLIFFVGFLYVFTSIFIFPVMVQFKMGLFSILKSSLLLSMSQLLTSLLSILVVAASLFILYFFPFTFVIIGSVTAYIMYGLCHRSFEKIQFQSSTEE